MKRYILRRVLLLVPTIAAIVSISFLLIHAAPGDPLLALAGEHGDASYYQFMEDRFGFDEPLPQRFATYTAHVLRGDFGTSYVQGRAAASLIAERIPATLLLTASALLLALLISIPLGAWSARKADTRLDHIIAAGALTIYSVPVFWLGQIAIIVIAAGLGWLPVEGVRTAGRDAAGFASFVDALRHLTLPVLVLASHEIAVLTRVTRNGVAEELSREHIRTARAKGVSERIVVLQHALPRALLALLTVLGNRAGQLLAGALVVEVVFGWPGMGRLLLTALQTRDAPVLLAFFFVISCTVLIANLITDLLYAALDPRIRYS